MGLLHAQLEGGGLNLIMGAERNSILGRLLIEIWFI